MKLACLSLVEHTPCLLKTSRFVILQIVRCRSRGQSCAGGAQSYLLAASSLARALIIILYLLYLVSEPIFYVTAPVSGFFIGYSITRCDMNTLC